MRGNRVERAFCSIDEAVTCLEKHPTPGEKMRTEARLFVLSHNPTLTRGGGNCLLGFGEYLVRKSFIEITFFPQKTTIPHFKIF
jgi:hypothetical protein